MHGRWSSDSNGSATNGFGQVATLPVHQIMNLI